MPSARQQRPDGVPVRRMVSGGQTGVDRAALDTAIARGIPYRGWAEDLGQPSGLKSLDKLNDSAREHNAGHNRGRR